MDQPILIAVLVGIGVYAAALILFRKQIFPKSTQYTRGMLDRLEEEKTAPDPGREDGPSMRFGFVPFILNLPVIGTLRSMLIRAGMADSIPRFAVTCGIVFLLVAFALRNFGIVAPLGALAATFLFGWWSVRRSMRKRNEDFLNYFPDALDMIVRGVKSGYPLGAAVRMVAENVQPPVSTEFKQVADEVSFGSTLIDALFRMSQRINEPDVKFFVVVLTVQQDVGGNLSEVLGKLASVIRKRKHLRLKIQAMASEGKATAWVLGSMPVVETLIIWAMTPSHLTPLFTTSLGNKILALTLAVMALGVFVIRAVINIKV